MDFVEIFSLIIYGIAISIFTVLSILVGFVAGIPVGVFISIFNYIKAICKETHFLTPSWDKDDEPAKRSYFFGPGYVQLYSTIVTMFALNNESLEIIISGAEKLKSYDSMFRKILNFGINAFQVVMSVVCYVLYITIGGTMFCVHGLIVTAFMAITLLIFSVVWLVDRIYLGFTRVFSDCPVCHHRTLIPHYRCPDCGRIHKKLVPGPYGIWFHRCTCKKLLPSTFLLGRGNLESVCSVCGNPVIASNVRPLSFQLVGEIYAGKTVYLASFFHEYTKMLEEKNIEYEIPHTYKASFQKLESWFSGTDCPATTDLNSQIYPVLINCGLKHRRLFSVYDIAGESFSMPIDRLPFEQNQFNYCDGILYLIDPTKSNIVNPKNSIDGIATAELVANNFINYLISTSTKDPSSRRKTPLTIIISKSDNIYVRKAVNEQIIINTFNSNREQYPTLESACNAVCEKFLIDIGYVAVIKSLKSVFENINYFPVSAIGHEANGKMYTPQGVITPFGWMIAQADNQFYKATFSM